MLLDSDCISMYVFSCLAAVTIANPLGLRVLLIIGVSVYVPSQQMSKFQKPDWVLNREIPAGETKGEQNKRHTKERKDLELYIRQNRVPNKVGN